MPTDCISYSETNYFSPLILDYLAEKKEVRPFYNRFPRLENFGEEIEEIKKNYDHNIRKDLVKVLKEQYQSLDTSAETQANIEALEKEDSYTVVTGHQLNLFTGPLYFLYKIVSTINLTRKLKDKYPSRHFVPIYWMATEDHDFEEINFFNLHGKKFKWNKADERAGKTAVGFLSTEGLDDVYELFASEIGGGENAEFLKELFKNAYLEHENLADATRFIANELFGQYGLVIIDAQEKELKKHFVPYAKNELFERVSEKKTAETVNKLNDLDYGIQVNPREINLFYLTEEFRKRIIQKDEKFFVNDTNIEWSREEMQEELENHPERFSPNVILRPLYQEVLLPNLCYIGGGGELSYWLELRSFFEAEKVTFPILLLRNSALIQTAKQNNKRERLGISLEELFLKQHELINRKVRKISNIDIDFSEQKQHLVDQFQFMYELAEKTDESFLGAVKAQEVKQLKGLDNLEKRLLKAQKRKLKDEVERIAALQNELFPNRSLQERQANFSEFYVEYGEDLVKELMSNLDPLESDFKILTFGEE